MKKSLLAIFAICFLTTTFSQGYVDIGGHTQNLFKIKNGSMDLLRDSTFEIKLPKSMWLIDTVTSIDPVTLNEQTTIQTTDTRTVHGFLGEFSKEDVKTAIANQFGIEKYIPYQLQSLQIMVLSDAGYTFTLDYTKPEQLEELKAKLDKLTGGVIIIIGDVTLIKKENGAYVTWPREMVALKVIN